MSDAKLGASDLATALRDVATQIEQMVSSLRDISVQVQALPDGAAPAPIPIAPITDLATSVPYRSQWDDDGNQFTSDCGPACVAMVLQYDSVWVDINQLAREAGMAPGRAFTLPADLIRAAGLHGVELVRKYAFNVHGLAAEIAAGRPVIALIHYADLGTLRQDQNYNKGHWVVVVEVDSNIVTIHDPDWRAPYRESGRALPVGRAIFEQAWVNCTLDGNTPNQCLVILPKP